MWVVELTDNQPSILPSCNAVILAETTKADLARLHHASLGFPVKSALLNAINKGFLTTFPGLDANLITKHLPKSEPTVKGHLDQERKNLQSTKTNPPVLPSSKPAT
jgi:hypothetical protein